MYIHLYPTKAYWTSCSCWYPKRWGIPSYARIESISSISCSVHQCISHSSLSTNSCDGTLPKSEQSQIYTIYWERYQAWNTFGQISCCRIFINETRIDFTMSGIVSWNWSSSLSITHSKQRITNIIKEQEIFSCCR